MDLKTVGKDKRTEAGAGSGDLPGVVVRHHGVGHVGLGPTHVPSRPHPVHVRPSQLIDIRTVLIYKLLNFNHILNQWLAVTCFKSRAA